jgi:hypothetical protein
MFIDGATFHQMQGVKNITHQHNVKPLNVWYEKVDHTPPSAL